MDPQKVILKMKKQKKKSWSPLRIGILGGGQLARMLCLSGAPMGHKMYVLSENASDPAAQVTSFWRQGSPHDENTIQSFCREIDVLGFESEFISGNLIQIACEQTQTPCFPPAATLSLLQDRFSQKTALKSLNIPTAEFSLFDPSLIEKSYAKNFPTGYVVKARTGGYDGKGTFIVKSLTQARQLLKTLNVQKADSFLVEAFMPFKRELAIMFFRDQFGSITHFPLVEIIQKDQRLDLLKGPVKHPALQNLIKKFKRFLNELNYCGAMGVELFDLGSELYVNEIAPRVHNSGHYSQLAISEDQFSLHIQCLAGKPLPKIKLLSPGFAMSNLIGTGRPSQFFPFDFEGEFHWYGKDKNLPGRKLGHINYLAKNADLALKLAKKEREEFSL